MIRWAACALLCLPVAADDAASALATTIARADDLLRNFETTATYHNVALHGLDAARRMAALELLALAETHADNGDAEAAERMLGLATEFPAVRWYESHFGIAEYAVVLAAENAVAEWLAGHSNAPVAPRMVRRRSGARAPYIPPYETEEWTRGQYRNRIDLSHFPDERARVTVLLDGEPAGRGNLVPPDKFVYARAGLGDYRISVDTGRRVMEFDYPALSIDRDGDTLRVNGQTYALDAALVKTRNDIASVLDKGKTALVLTEPSPTLLRAASDSGLAVVVRPLEIEDDVAATIAMHGGTATRLQEALRDRMAAYSDLGGVWLWDLGVVGRPCETLAEAMLGPVFDYCAPRSRPRAEHLAGYAP